MEADWVQQQENNKALQRDMMNTQFRQAGAGLGGDGDGSDDSDDEFFHRGRRANLPRFLREESSRSSGRRVPEQPRQVSRTAGDVGREFLRAIESFNGTNQISLFGVDFKD